MYRKLFCTLMLGAATLSTPAIALTATHSIEREVIVRHADGSQSVRLERADTVTPGDKIVYSLNYFNDEAETVEDIVLIMPVPKEIQYLEGSANMDNVQTAYSVDAGKTFEARNILRVKLADGRNRAANADDITHIRWTVVKAVAPETGGKLSFSGRLK